MLPALLEESGSTSPLQRMRRRLGIGLFIALCTLAFAGLLGCGGGERQDEDEPEGEFPVEIVSAEWPAKQRLAQTTELRLTVANVGDETIPDLAVTVNTQADTAAEADADAAEPDVTETEETGTETSEDSDGELSEEEQAEVDQALEEEIGEATGVTPGDDESSEEEETTTESTETDASEEAGESGEASGGTAAQARGAFSVLAAQPDLAIPSRPVWILEQGYPRKADEPAGEPPPGELSGAGGAETAQTNTFAFGELEPNATVELVWVVTAVQDGTYTVRYRLAAGLQGKAVAVNEDGSEPEGEFVVRISDVPPQTRVDDSGKVVPIEKGDIIGQAGTEEQKGELGE